MLKHLVLLALLCTCSGPSFAEFGMGCLPEPPGALDGVPVFSKPPPPVPGPRPAFGAQPGELPPAMDNSTQSCFPPIGDQGSQDACSAWVTIYYYQGYLQRRDKGWSGGASSNLFSPAFGYNQLRAETGGSIISDYMKMLARLGACTLADMSYVAADDNTQPDETDFRNAAEFRTLGFAYFIVTNDEGVVLLKQHLASTNIAVTSMNVYSNFLFATTNGTTNTFRYSAVTTNANVMVGQSGVYIGGHAVTIVGYDDNKAYGTNSGQKGAFKMANSWGTNWGNRGFFWVGYEYFKTIGTSHEWNNDNQCYVMWDREGYEPKAYMTIRTTHPRREQIRLAVGVKDGMEVYRYYYYGCAYAARTNYTNSPYLYTYPGGVTNSPDLVLDVSELLHYTKDALSSTWLVLLGDAWKDGITGTVDYVKIESYGASVETNLNAWIYEDMTDGQDLGTQISLDIAINRPNPQILFIDGDWSLSGTWYPNSWASNYRCYTYGYEVDPLQSLTAMAVTDSNVEFQAVNLDTQVLPSLTGYAVVYWLTGKYAAFENPTVCPLVASDIRTLTNYMGRGGRLLLEGEAVCPSLGNTHAFVSNWLRVGSTAWESNTPPPMVYLNGATNDPVSGGMFLPFSPDNASATYQQRPNKAAAGNGAASLFTRSDNGDACGVRFDSGNYRVVHFPFELYGVGDVKDRYTLMQRALSWIAENELVVVSANGGAAPVGTNSYRKGTTVECRLTNSSITAGSTQFVCGGWSGTGSVPSAGSGTNVSFALTNNSRITWLWTTNFLFAVAAGEHGTASGGGWKAYGSNVAALATASNYYHFSVWTGDVSLALSASNPLNVVIDQPRSIAAQFTENLATNGTPEWWLAAYGWTNNFDAAATNDSDHDGAAAWEEWVALTDPTNRWDSFMISSAANTAGGNVITWVCRTGRTYDVSWFTNFAFEGGMVSSNMLYPQSRCTDTVNSSKSLIFYRVRVGK